jgi:predicted ATPase
VFDLGLLNGDLKLALKRARMGHGQIVAAMAEPGVGKSRLFFEFKAISQSECMVLETFSVSHGKASTYLPVIDLLHGYFKIASEDDVRARREKVTGRVLALRPGLEGTLPYLFALLGVAETPDSLAQMDGQRLRNGGARGDQADSIAREPQSASDGDL